MVKEEAFVLVVETASPKCSEGQLTSCALAQKETVCWLLVINVLGEMRKLLGVYASYGVAEAEVAHPFPV